MKSIEVEVIEKMVAMCGGDRVLAAGVLGVALKTIYNKIGKHRGDQTGGG
jgi:DNA-binding NtrC family response regulator